MGGSMDPSRNFSRSQATQRYRARSVHEIKMDSAYMLAAARVLDQLDSFGNKTLSTSSKSENRSARDRGGVEIVEVSTIFEQGGIVEVDPMDAPTWNRFCKGIRSTVDPTVGEVEGIHPVMKELMRGCMGRRHRDLLLVYEGKFESEDSIMKKPDMSVVVVNLRNKFGAVIATVAIPIEAKKLGDIQRAISQALGYLASRLKAQVPTVDLQNSTLSGFAVGFDGEEIVIGFMEIVDFKLVVLQSETMLLWPASGDAPSSETEGVRALRSLFSATAGQLGMTPQTISIHSTILLQHMLGRGSFCMAIAARDVNDEDDVFVVKTPNYPVSLGQARHDQVAQMTTEWQYLRQLSVPTPSPYLPTLRAGSPPPSADSLMILMGPVGVPLAVYVAPMKRADRLTFADRLSQHLLLALQHALAQNVCHTDIRPDNVIVFEDRAILIDWGLARAPQAPVHNCRGGLPFFDDELVLHYHSVVNKSKQHPPVPALRFSPHFDTASVLYVVEVVKRGYGRLSPPWAEAGTRGQRLVALRHGELQKPLEDVFAARANLH